MGDRYATFAHSRPGRAVVRRLGLPEPPVLRRHRPGEPLVTGPVLLGGAPGGSLQDPLRAQLARAGVDVVAPDPEPPRPVPLHAALVFDASGITDIAGLAALQEFFQPYVRSLGPSGRVLVWGRPPATAGGVAGAVGQRSLEGFIRSLGRELRGGATAQLVQVAPGAEEATESTLRFLLSARSAYVSGQVFRIGPAGETPPADWDRPLAGMVAVVTGAAHGIGAAAAEALARDGAQVTCLDLPGSGDALAAVANRLGGTALQVDLTAADAPRRVVDHLAARHGRLDILVNNAGITRDRTLAKMDTGRFTSVLEVNLAAPLRLTEAVVAAGLMPAGGRVVNVSSINGIAGAKGQTNYAASKAGVIGLTEALAAELAPGGITVNAVAPGFIETRMTASMPAATREVGRRINSLAQGGLPVDVAEAMAYLASPGSAGITGQVLRVCGQSLMGA